MGLFGPRGSRLRRGAGRFATIAQMPERPIPRRDVFKYALSPALLSLGTLAAPGGPTASAAAAQLIDFAERRIAPDEIKAAGYDGVINYVSEERPGAHFEAKPITRDYADALRAAGLHIVSNFQYGKPGWAAHRRITPAGMTAAWPTLRPRCGCTMQPVVRLRLRSFSASTTTSTSTPGIALRSTGFGESTRSWAWSAPASMGTPTRVGGRQGRRDRALHHPRVSVGVADEGMVEWRARAHGGAVSGNPRGPRPERHQSRRRRCPCTRLRAMGSQSVT